MLLTRNAQSRYDFYGIDSKVKLYEGNINTCQFPTGDFTHIIHGANPPISAEPQEVYYAIVDGTARILEWAARSGIQKFPPAVVWRRPRRADDGLRRGKRMAELLLRCQQPRQDRAHLHADRLTAYHRSTPSGSSSARPRRRRP
jgi:hypothetical protein